jgi:hypothetical protein
MPGMPGVIRQQIRDACAGCMCRVPVRTSLTPLKARGARRAPLARDPAPGSATWRAKRRAPHSASGRKRPWDSRVTELFAPAFAPAAARRAAARALPRAQPVTSQPASRPPTAPAWERPFSRCSSLEPTKITVNGYPACGIRVACCASADPGL